MPWFVVINEGWYMLVVNDKELVIYDTNDSDILTNTVTMGDMEVYTYILNL